VALIERECWSRVEARRIDEGLREARFWQQVEPHKLGFWDVFETTVLAHYPDCRFKLNDQLTLSEFSATAE